jgi:hypothetical protein
VTSNSGLREPGLREIALKIVSVPGFGNSEASLTCALEAWRKALTPGQWQHAAEALICGFLLDVRAEYERDLPVVARPRTSDPQPPRAGGIRFVEAVVEPEPVDEPAGEPDSAPVAVLRHRSESEDWATLSIPDKVSGPERLPAPKRGMPPSPKFGPVIVSHVADRAPVSESQAVLTAVRASAVPALVSKPVHVQQDGWKVPALRNMKVFPSLANRVTINGLATREGELTKAQIPLRLEQIDMQCRASRDKDTHQQARIDRRNELNRHDEAEMRVRRAYAQELQAEAGRLAAVERVLAERPDGTTITELDAKVLIECGYERRSA